MCEKVTYSFSIRTPKGWKSSEKTYDSIEGLTAAIGRCTEKLQLKFTSITIRRDVAKSDEGSAAE